MYKVYILQSINKPNKTYVGFTIKDIKDRLKEHNLGLSKASKAYKPWNLIYFETFHCRLDAEKREQFLKSGFGYRFRRVILDNYSKL